MKKKAIILLLVCNLLLSGCSIKSPFGSFDISFNDEESIDNVQIVDSDGSVTEIDVTNIDVFVDKLLNDIDMPNGGSSSELKEFVYNSLEILGIDLNNLVTDEDKKEAENAIKDILKEKGVDTSDLNIDLSDLNK